MRYTITITVGKDKYGYDEVKNEATIEADELPINTLKNVTDSMIVDIVAKVHEKFTKAAPDEPPASYAPAPIILE